MTEFRGIDILLDRAVAMDDISNIVADAFQLHRASVQAIDDITNYPADATMVCLVTPVKGDFCSLVALQSGPLNVNHAVVDMAIQEIADKLGCRCLVPDSELNPYTMRLFTPGSTPIAVSLDPSADDDNVYRLSRTWP